jgi:hypothetical protein
MIRSPLPWLWPVIALTVASAASAQTDRAAKPDPLDPHASVPAVRHESSLSGFRRLTDQKPVPWREANETVGRIGGWRTYAREAREPAPSESTPAAGSSAESPTPAAKPPAPGGAGSHKH